MVMKAELVFIPSPAMGHLVSMVELAKLLVDLDSNLSITLLIVKSPHDARVTAYVDSLTASLTSSATRIKFINLPSPKIEPLDVNLLKLMSTLVQTQRSLVKELVTNIVQYSSSVPDSPRLAGFVLDLFFTPLIDLAIEFGVPSYCFYTSGAAILGFHFYTQALHDEHNVNIVELKDSDNEFTIPSYLNPVSSKFFPTLMLAPESFSMVNNLIRGLREVKGIIINTFSELQSHAVASLLSDVRLPPVYPVGPLLNLESASSIHQNSDTMKWLDEQPPSSVVFLCFGSMGSFNRDQVKEIAYALEQSGYRFLWSLCQPPDPSVGQITSPTDYDKMSEVLPEGFLDRMAGIGKIIGWAPQVAILSHPAIGGFVSHCGWNSTLESIWFGVPMATWPLYAEQQLNAFELVTELGLAVEIKMDYRNWWEAKGITEIEIVRAEKIERGIRCLMEQNSDVRKKVKEMSEKSRNALIEGGSSRSNLHGFVNDVMDTMLGKIIYS